MSRILRKTGAIWLLAVIIIAGTPSKQTLAQPGASVSFQMFYNDLQPHGQWFSYGNYGYCWTPNVANFRPYYTNGHWAMTDYGNTWVSNYSWGWAPFHYGRWVYDDYYGWIWVPGTTWAPAHVSWRTGGGMYGWAPLAPGVSVNVAISPAFNCGYDRWVFVPQRYVYQPNFHRYWRGPQYNRTVINNTTIINNTYINNRTKYVYGPRSNEYQRATGQRVTTYNVRSGRKPGRDEVRGRELNMYRPQVQQRSNERPQRIASNTEVRRSAQTHQRTGTPQATMNGGNVRSQRGPTAQRSTAPAQRSASPARSSRANSAPQRAQAPAARSNTRNTAPTRSRTTTPARQQQAQQQKRITERRQQSWQQQRSPSRAQQPATRSTAPTRSQPSMNRSNPSTHRNTQQARPQSQTRPQRSAAPARSTQRSAAPARSSSPQRSAAPSRTRSSSRSAAPSRSTSGGSNSRGRASRR